MTPWAGGRWNKLFLSPSEIPRNPRPIPEFSGYDGGGIHGSHCNVFSAVVASDGTREPAFRAYRMRTGVTSFDYQVADHHGLQAHPDVDAESLDRTAAGQGRRRKAVRRPHGKVNASLKE